MRDGTWDPIDKKSTRTVAKSFILEYEGPPGTEKGTAATKGTYNKWDQIVFVQETTLVHRVSWY